MALLIGLLGVSGTGKNVVATRLLDHGFARLRFGDPIRDMMRAGFQLTDDEIDGPRRAKPLWSLCNLTPAAVMNSLGEQWGRKFIDPKLWARQVERRAGELLSDGRSLVVPDIRRDFEASAIVRLGGTLVRIERVGFPDKFLEHVRAPHALVNTGQDDLKAATDGLLVELMKGVAA